MHKFSVILTFLFVNLSIVGGIYIPRQEPGAQFITGPCTSDADCASGCCGFNTGKCAGPIVAQERDGGCGFGDPEPNDDAAQALRGSNGAATPADNAASNDAAGNDATATSAAAPATGTQFITGECTSDADCASGCCGFNTGKCAGPVVAQERDGGCGFGDASPNNDAAVALQGPNAQSATPANNSQAGADDDADEEEEEEEADDATATSPAPAAGTQFITGECSSDADCASGCCGFNTGKCAGPIVAQERDGGCGFGDAQPNDNAAQLLRGQ